MTDTILTRRELHSREMIGWLHLHPFGLSFLFLDRWFFRQILTRRVLTRSVWHERMPVKKGAGEFHASLGTFAFQFGCDLLHESLHSGRSFWHGAHSLL